MRFLEPLQVMILLPEKNRCGYVNLKIFDAANISNL